MQYSEKVMEHFANPQNAGVIENPDAMGEVGSVICGDIMKISLAIDDATETIEDIKFQTFGCGAAIAVSSVFTEMVKGLTMREALAISNDDVVTELEGLPAVKVHCSVLAEEGMAVAIQSYYEAHPDKTPPEGLAEKIEHLKSVDPHAEE